MNDVAALNAMVLYQKSHGNAKVNRREFLYNLSQQLMKDQKEASSQSTHWLNAAFRKIAESYEFLRKKFAGEAPTKFYRCPICQKTQRDPHFRLCPVILQLNFPSILLELQENGMPRAHN